MINIHTEKEVVVINYHDAFKIFMSIKDGVFTDVYYDIIIIIDGTNSGESVFAYKRLYEIIDKRYDSPFTVMSTSCEYSSDLKVDASFYRKVKDYRKILDTQFDRDRDYTINGLMNTSDGQKLASVTTDRYGDWKENAKAFVDFIFKTSNDAKLLEDK